MVQYGQTGLLTIFWLLVGPAPEDRDGVSGLHGIMGNIYEGQHTLCIKVMSNRHGQHTSKRVKKKKKRESARAWQETEREQGDSSLEEV